MTDLTDQDRRAARKWAERIIAHPIPGDHTLLDEDAAARIIIATVEAPAPTLAEELAAPLAGRPSAEHVVFDADSVCRLADRAKQMEQELKEVRAEVARLRATHPNVEGTRHGYDIRHTMRKDQE